MAPELKIGAPEGSLIEISESGYIDSALFVKWLDFFIKTVHPSKEKKVLLCLDGHTTHSKNLQALELARDHGVILLQLPSHTTHKLQPLDVSFFKPLETFYIQEIQKHLRTYPNLTISLFQVSQIFTPAYRRAATLENAASGFKNTGIWPVNRHIFRDHEFAAGNNLQTNTTHVTSLVSPALNEGNTVIRTHQLHYTNNFFTENIENVRPPNGLLVSVAELSPVPQSKQVKGKRKSREAQKACILTESPYKKELEARKQIKNKKSYKKKIVIEKDDTCKPSTSKQADEIWHCILCKKNEKLDMIQCQECRKWVHAVCGNVSPQRKFYFCPYCLNLEGYE